MAQTLYFRGRIPEAYSISVAKASEFPESWHLLYDVARYACLLGKWAEAEQFFQLAMVVGDANSIKLQALDDPDLDGLWRAEPCRKLPSREALLAEWQARP